MFYRSYFTYSLDNYVSFLNFTNFGSERVLYKKMDLNSQATFLRISVQNIMFRI